MYVHLAPRFDNGKTGMHAVYGFFVLSGFLMTLVISERYTTHYKGLIKYAINRFLRIFPTYWTIIVISLIAILILSPDDILIRSISYPKTLSDFVKNLFIIGLEGGYKLRLVPPAWSLSIELVYYAVIPVVLAFGNKKGILIWFLISIVLTIIQAFGVADIKYKYTALLTGSLPFSFGSLLYFYKDSLGIIFRKYIVVTFALFLTFALTSKSFTSTPQYGAYISIIFTGLLIIGLFNLDKSNYPVWVLKLDKFLGDIAYPVFLIHWLVAGILTHTIFSPKDYKTLPFFIVSFIIVNLLSIGIHYLLEERVNKIRDSVKKWQ